MPVKHYASTDIDALLRPATLVLHDTHISPRYSKKGIDPIVLGQDDPSSFWFDKIDLKNICVSPQYKLYGFI